MKLPYLYLLDINKRITRAWQQEFAGCPDVEIVYQDFETFMNEHPEVDAIVSPANSFGIMNGGYDLAITRYFGQGLQKEVQKTILEEYLGEQPVGTSIVVPIPGQSGKVLIHTPSMRMPEIIIDPRVIYTCTRTALIAAMKHDVQKMVVPAFGGLTGQVPAEVVAKMMKGAYEQVVRKVGEVRAE